MYAVQKDRDRCIALLVRNLHAEIIERMSRAIESQEGVKPECDTLPDLFANRPWLFGEYDYYVDASHLVSRGLPARYGYWLLIGAIPRPWISNSITDAWVHKPVRSKNVQVAGENELSDSGRLATTACKIALPSLSLFKSKATFASSKSRLSNQ